MLVSPGVHLRISVDARLWLAVYLGSIGGRGPVIIYYHLKVDLQHAAPKRGDGNDHQDG